jgi:hypothetical protein
VVVQVELCLNVCDQKKAIKQTSSFAAYHILTHCFFPIVASSSGCVSCSSGYMLRLDFFLRYLTVVNIHLQVKSDWIIQSNCKFNGLSLDTFKVSVILHSVGFRYG